MITCKYLIIDIYIQLWCLRQSVTLIDTSLIKNSDKSELDIFCILNLLNMIMVLVLIYLKQIKSLLMSNWLQNYQHVIFIMGTEINDLSVSEIYDSGVYIITCLIAINHHRNLWLLIQNVNTLIHYTNTLEPELVLLAKNKGQKILIKLQALTALLLFVSVFLYVSIHRTMYNFQ